MLAYIVRRLIISFFVLILVSFISFFIITMAPGSPFPWGDLNPEISEATRQIYIDKFHLDEPLPKQYWFIMSDLFRGKLVSNKDERPVLVKIGERLPATLLLNITSLAIIFGFGIPLGVFAARYSGKWPDHLVTLIAFALIALPGFWVSYMVAIFLVQYMGAPLLGLSSYGAVYAHQLQEIMDRLWHLFIPAGILALGGIAVQSRYVRASMLESLSEDFVRTAKAKGLPDTLVFYKHALRTSLRPVITFIGFLLPALLGGSVIIESIFAYPGIGRLGYEAIMERDYPVLVTLNFVVALLVLLGNLFADILYAVVDPRVRLN